MAAAAITGSLWLPFGIQPLAPAFWVSATLLAAMTLIKFAFVIKGTWADGDLGERIFLFIWILAIIGMITLIHFILNGVV